MSKAYRIYYRDSTDRVSIPDYWSDLIDADSEAEAVKTFHATYAGGNSRRRAIVRRVEESRK